MAATIVAKAVNHDSNPDLSPDSFRCADLNRKVPMRAVKVPNVPPRPVQPPRRIPDRSATPDQPRRHATAPPADPAPRRSRDAGAGRLIEHRRESLFRAPRPAQTLCVSRPSPQPRSSPARISTPITIVTILSACIPPPMVHPFRPDGPGLCVPVWQRRRRDLDRSASPLRASRWDSESIDCWPRRSARSPAPASRR